MNRFNLQSFWIGAHGTLAVMHVVIAIGNGSMWSLAIAALCGFIAWSNWAELRDRT
jgi:hypothetical protein